MRISSRGTDIPSPGKEAVWTSFICQTSFRRLGFHTRHTEEATTMCLARAVMTSRMQNI